MCAVRYLTFDVTVTCRVDADTERCDYGVKGSPVWDEIKPETLEVSMISIDDMSGDVLECIKELAYEKALEDGEWQ